MNEFKVGDEEAPKPPAAMSPLELDIRQLVSKLEKAIEDIDSKDTYGEDAIQDSYEWGKARAYEDVVQELKNILAVWEIDKEEQQ